MSTNKNNNEVFGHPKGLFLLFTVEMWERFSYYGMRAIFILFLTKALLLDTKQAGSVFGIYTSLVYATPLLGGYIADRYWGNRRSILVGGILMAIAQFLMFASASLYTIPATGTLIMYVALGFLIFGNGFFKPNISSMVGTLYKQGDSRIDSAYTIFYMGINAGALVAPLVCGGLGDTGAPTDFKWGFLAAGIGMVVGTLIMVIYQNKYVVTPDGEPIGLKPSFYKKQLDESQLEEANAKQTLTKVEKDRILAIFIITAFVIAFWAAFEQAGASLTLFADQNTDRDLFGWTIPASFFQSINPIFIIILAPLFSVIWSTLSKKNREPSSPMKMVWGLAILALGYVVIAFSVKGIGMEEKISMFFLVGMYFLHTAGELAISPVGLSVVNKLSPKRFASIMMAVFFLSSVVGNFAAGLFSGLIPQPELNTIVVVENSQNYDEEDVLELTTALVNKSGNPLEPAILKAFKDEGLYNTKRLNRKKIGRAETLHNSESKLIRGDFENKTLTFGAYSDMTETLPEIKLNESVAAEYRGDHDVMLRDITVNGEHVGAMIFKNAKNSLFGIEISSLYAFFIIFIVMSGATSVLLLVLHKRIEKLMHGVR